MELGWSHHKFCPCFSTQQLAAGVVFRKEGDLPRLLDFGGDPCTKPLTGGSVVSRCSEPGEPQ